MVKRDFPNSPTNMKPKWAAWFRAFLIVVLIGNVLISLFWWFVPLEVFESWAFEAGRSRPPEFKQFEAVGRAEFSCWLIRFASPIIAVVAAFLLLA